MTLLLSSPVALNHTSSRANPASSEDGRSTSDAHTIDHIPRHFMVVSKPCIHPDCPPREGFVRGQYESVEFIREIPNPTTTSHNVLPGSEVPGPERHRANTASLARDSIIRNASRAHTFPVNLDPTQNSGVEGGNAHLSAATEETNGNSIEGRKRGKTISFVEPSGRATKLDEAAESNPVEWIMITRSDPGGSVPRWMVERGTPASIVADAAKFLDWACKLEDSPTDGDQENRPGMPDRELSNDLQALDMNGHLWGIDGITETTQNSSQPGDKEFMVAQAGGARSMVTAGDLAGHSMEMNKLVNDTDQQLAIPEAIAPAPRNNESIAEEIVSDSDTTSLDSFATASSKERGSEGDGHDRTSVINDADSSRTTASNVEKDIASSSPSAAHEKERAKLHERTRRLQEKLAATRSKILPTGITSSSDLPPKESAALAKAEERHRKGIEKQEQRYRTQVKKIESKREREERKKEEKRKKLEEKDNRARWSKEREELKRQIEVSKSEVQALMGQIGELQNQNTLLAAKLGKIDPEALQEVLAEMEALSKAVRGTDVGPINLTSSGKEDVKIDG